MEYIKFNCYDLAEQGSAIHEAHAAMQRLAAQIGSAYAALEPQTLGSEAIRSRLMAARDEAAESAHSLLLAYNALDRAVDIYYAAERKALQAAEALPAGFGGAGGAARPAAQAAVHTSAAISGEDLVMEDWLAELLYSQTE
jgi:hypothetical protein